MAEMVKQIWPVGTDCKIVIRGLRDDAGTGISDAVVSGILKQATGVPVANAANLTFTANGSGDYFTIVPHDAELQDGKPYTMDIIAVKGSKRLFAKVTRNAAFVNM